MAEEFNDLVAKRCLKIIKQSLKSNGFTYSYVAEILNVSKATVKRLLNHSDISLDRLLKLCELCGLNVNEVIQQANNIPNPLQVFTDRQDKAFDEAPHLLSYFSELFYHQKSPQQIQDENDLTELSTYKYLRMLENIELIELKPQNKLRIIPAPPLGFASDSRVLRKSIKKHIEQTCEFVMNSDENETHFMRVKPIRISDRLFNELEKELKKVIDKYSELAELVFVDSQNCSMYQVTILGHPLEDEEIFEHTIINIDVCD